MGNIGNCATKVTHNKEVAKVGFVKDSTINIYFLSVSLYVSKRGAY